MPRTTVAAALTCLLAVAAIPSVESFVQSTVPKPVSRDALLAAGRAIMKAAGVCAVITVDEAGRPRARAIEVFEPDEQFVVWFATNPKSAKVEQIRRNDRVTVYCYDPASKAYATLLGRARLVNDPAEKQKRWKKGFEAFWPDRGDGYLLVEIRPVQLEVVHAAGGIGTDPVTWAPLVVLFGPEKTP